MEVLAEDLNLMEQDQLVHPVSGIVMYNAAHFPSGK
jgi:hypothetical protein